MTKKALALILGSSIWLLTLLALCPDFDARAWYGLIFVLLIICVPISEKRRIFLSSFATCLLPTISSGLILLLWGGIYLTNKECKLSRDGRWVWPIVLVIFAWFLGFYWWRWDVRVIDFWKTGVFGSPLHWSASLKAIGAALQELKGSWLIGVRWLLLGVLVSWFARTEQNWKSIESGFIVGTFCAFLALCVQVTGLVSAEAFPQLNEFWRSLNRFPGTFTDPNACGIASLLIGMLLINKITFAKEGKESLTTNATHIVFLFLVLVIGAFSGSRTFFLGAGLLILFSLFRAKPKLFIPGIAAIAIVISTISLFEANHLSLVEWLNSKEAPSGIVRIASALSLQNLSDTVFSRVVFLDLILQVIREHLVFGVGPGEFYRMVPGVASKLGLGTGLWADNSNNFYLGILAELGLLGALAFVCSLSNLKWRAPASLFRLDVIVMAVILLLGPHLDFPEITILFAFILARACVVSVPKFRLVYCIAACPVVVAIMIASRFTDFGLSIPENSDAKQFQWSAALSEFALNCDCSGKANLVIQAPQIMQLGLNSLSVKTDSQENSYVLVSDKEYIFPVKCPEKSNLPETASRTVRVKLEVDPPWIPALVKEYHSQDWRLLGVKRVISSEFQPSICP